MSKLNTFKKGETLEAEQLNQIIDRINYLSYELLPSRNIIIFNEDSPQDQKIKIYCKDYTGDRCVIHENNISGLSLFYKIFLKEENFSEIGNEFEEVSTETDEEQSSSDDYRELNIGSSITPRSNWEQVEFKLYEGNILLDSVIVPVITIKDGKKGDKGDKGNAGQDGNDGNDGQNGIMAYFSPGTLILNEIEKDVIDYSEAYSELIISDGGSLYNAGNFDIRVEATEGCEAHAEWGKVYIEVEKDPEDSSKYCNKGFVLVTVRYKEVEYPAILRFYVNLVGTWKEEIIGDTKSEIATSELFEIDEISGKIVESDNLGEYIRNSREYSNTITKINTIEGSVSRMQSTIEGNAAAIALKVSKETFNDFVEESNSLFELTSENIDLKVDKNDLEQVGIHLDGEKKTITLNAENTIVSGDFYAPRIKSIGDGKYSEIDGGKFSLGLYKNDELEEDENPFKEYFRINIDNDGNAVLEYLDGNGKVIGQINSSFFENQTVIADSWSPLRAAKITDSSYLSANHKFNYIRNNLNNNLTDSISNYYKYVKGYTKGQETSDDKNGKYFTSPNPNSLFMNGYFLSENTYTTQINRLPQLMQFERVQEDSTHLIQDTNVNSDGSLNTVHYYEVYYVHEGQLLIQYVCSDGKVRSSKILDSPVEIPEENSEG